MVWLGQGLGKVWQPTHSWWERVTCWEPQQKSAGGWSRWNRMSRGREEVMLFGAPYFFSLCAVVCFKQGCVRSLGYRLGMEGGSQGNKSVNGGRELC